MSEKWLARDVNWDASPGGAISAIYLHLHENGEKCECVVTKEEGGVEQIKCGVCMAVCPPDEKIIAEPVNH